MLDWLGLLNISTSLSQFLFCAVVVEKSKSRSSQFELPAILWFESNELSGFDNFEHDDDSFNEFADPIIYRFYFF